MKTEQTCEKCKEARREYGQFRCEEHYDETEDNARAIAQTGVGIKLACGHTDVRPALSRYGHGNICSGCATREALEGDFLKVKAV